MKNRRRETGDEEQQERDGRWRPEMENRKRETERGGKTVRGRQEKKDGRRGTGGGRRERQR